MQAVGTDKRRGVIHLTARKHHRHAHSNKHVSGMFALMGQCLIAGEYIVQRSFCRLIKFLVTEIVFTPVACQCKFRHQQDIDMGVHCTLNSTEDSGYIALKVERNLTQRCCADSGVICHR